MLAYPQLWAAPAAVGEHTLPVAAGMDGERTCSAGCPPQQPVEVSRYLHCSCPTASQPEWEVSCLYPRARVRLGLASGAWPWAIFVLSAGTCSAYSHQFPIRSSCHWQGILSPGGSTCTASVGTGNRREDMGYSELKRVFPRKDGEIISLQSPHWQRSQWRA